MEITTYFAHPAATEIMRTTTLFMLLATLYAVTADEARANAPGDTRAGTTATVRSRAKAPKKLAPGVLTVIRPVPEEDETKSGPREVVEVVHGIQGLDWQPIYSPKSETVKEIAKQMVFRRPVWNLEFAFKPLRMIIVDVPQPSGRMKRKLIWYMVYRVKNNGNHMRPSSKQDQWGHKTYTTDRVHHTVRFFPQFILESHDYKKAYLDRLIPAAKGPIRKREDPNIRLYDSVNISSVDIKVSTPRTDRSVWGVAMWENVDPKIDFFSIYIKGLTNAYIWEDPPGAYKPGDPPGKGRQFTYKTLKLNFWRTGDAVNPHEKEIHYGVPTYTDRKKQDIVHKAYGVSEAVDHLWIYR